MCNSQCQHFLSSLLSKCFDWLGFPQIIMFILQNGAPWRYVVHEPHGLSWRRWSVAPCYLKTKFIPSIRIYSIIFQKDLLPHGGDKESWFKLFMLLDWKFRDPLSNSGLTCGSQILAGRQSPGLQVLVFRYAAHVCKGSVLNSILDFAPCGQSF